MNYDTFANLLFSRVRRADVTLALIIINAMIFALLVVMSIVPVLDDLMDTRRRGA